MNLLGSFVAKAFFAAGTVWYVLNIWLLLFGELPPITFYLAGGAPC